MANSETQTKAEMTNDQEFAELQWCKFPVLDKGWVCLVDRMGDDAAILQAARTSYGGESGKKTDDGTLLRYLMRHQHDSPFESCMIKLQVYLPLAIEAQWCRHRVAGWSQVSYRYKEVKNEAHIPSIIKRQSSDNKQGGSEPLEDYIQEECRGALEHTAKVAFENYRGCLREGMSREDARLQLPLGTYTEKVWWCNLRGLLHFLALRMDSHAQWQIREYATIIGEQIVKPLFPLTWQAFLDYRFNAMQLTALDIAIIQKMCGEKENRAGFMQACPPQWQGERCREREECWEKLLKLGIVHE